MAATNKPVSSTTTAGTPSSFLNLIKEGLLLSDRNRRLFAAIFAILVAWISLLLAANELGVEPLKHKAVGDMDALRSSTDGDDYDRLVRETLDDYGVLLLAGAAYQVCADVTGAAVQLVALFAAVTTYSSVSVTVSGDGEAPAAVRTFGALLGRSRQLQLVKGAAPTAAFVCAVKAGAVALLSAASALVAFLALCRRSPPRWHRGMFLAAWLVLLVAFVCYVYLSFLCSLAVVVAVDELLPPAASRRRGGHGGAGAGAAVRRAWKLVKGRQQRRAVLFVSLTSVLAAVFRPVYWLARICAGSGGMPAGALLLGALYAVEMAAVDLFQSCALTAFYYECKGRLSSAQEQQPEMTEYVKLSVEDA